MIDKQTVFDSRLSLAERGFLIAILALPDDWRFNIRGLASRLMLSKNSVARHLTAIMKAGYCSAAKTRGADGRFECDYTVFERPELASTQNGDRTSTQNTSPVIGDILIKELQKEREKKEEHDLVLLCHKLTFGVNHDIIMLWARNIRLAHRDSMST